MSGLFDYFRFQKLSAYRTYLVLTPGMSAIRFYVYVPVTFDMTFGLYHGYTFCIAAGFTDMIRVPSLFACRCYRLDLTITMPGRVDLFRFQNLIAYHAFLMHASVMRAVYRHVYDPLAFRMP